MAKKNFSAFCLLILTSAVAYGGQPTDKVNIGKYIDAAKRAKKFAEALEDQRMADTPAPESVTVESFLSSFFASTSCVSPAIQKEIDGNKNKMIPDDIAASIKDVKDKQVSGAVSKTLSAVLHGYEISNDDGIFSGQPRFLAAAITLDTYNPYRNLDKQHARFVYMLDCTGYVSQLAKADVGLGFLNAKGAMSEAFNKEQTYLASRGLMTNIIAAALEPDIVSKDATLTNEEALSVLGNLLAEVKKEGLKKQVKVPVRIEVISTSRSSNTKLQGEVNVSGDAKAGVPSGSISTDLKSGFGISKKIDFLAPVSVIIRDEGEAGKYDVSYIKGRFKSSMQKVSVVGQKRVDDSQLIFLDVPPNVCGQPTWKASARVVENGKESVYESVLTSSYGGQERACQISLKIDDQVNKLKADKATITISPSGSVFDLYDAKELPTYKVPL